MEEMIHQLDTVLQSLKIRYVIIGGIAASILGRPRTTLDADVVIATLPADPNELLRNLKSHGFGISESSQPKMLLRLKRLLPVKIRFGKVFSVDLRVASYTIDRQTVERAISVRLFGRKLPIATAEDIIVFKIARFEDMDKADIKAIIIRSGNRLDIQYIRASAITLARETGDASIRENLREVVGWMRKKESGR